MFYLIQKCSENTLVPNKHSIKKQGFIRLPNPPFHHEPSAIGSASLGVRSDGPSCRFCLIAALAEPSYQLHAPGLCRENYPLHNGRGSLKVSPIIALKTTKKC